VETLFTGGNVPADVIIGTDDAHSLEVVNNITYTLAPATDEEAPVLQRLSDESQCLQKETEQVHPNTQYYSQHSQSETQEISEDTKLAGNEFQMLLKNGMTQNNDSEPKSPSTIDELFSQIANIFDMEEIQSKNKKRKSPDLELRTNLEKSESMEVDTPSIVDTVLSFDDDIPTCSELLSSASSFFIEPKTILKPREKMFSPTTSDSDYESIGSPASDIAESVYNLDSSYLDQLFPTLL